MSLDVAVVVATHDRASRLAALLDALEAQTLGADRFEVIVVDDGSSDATAALLAARVAAGALRLRVLRHAAARGPAVARQAGWRAASAPLVAFTDDDCRPAPGWLAAGVAAWGGDPARFVQGRVDPDPAEAATEGPFSRTLRVRALGPWFQTANVFYPRALLEQVGGFDERIFWAAEDADLAWRCVAAGATPAWAPEAQVWHAVHQLGPVGKLRAAWRWHEIVRLFATHPPTRAVLTYRVFWKKSHYLLVRAAIGLLVPWAPLRFWCLAPLPESYVRRARDEGGTAALAPYFLVHDLIELAAVARGAARHRTLVL